jgi:hypothetical protein
MSTATVSTPDTAPRVIPPPSMWRSYAQERRMGSSQREAASHAFAAHPRFRKSDTLEAFRQQLADREAEHGLALTESEYEEEIIREAEAGEEPEPGSLEAIRADAARSVVQLEEAKARLAPEAIAGDPDVLAELASIETELSRARAVSELSDLAETETARRAREAREQAERQAHEQAEQQAQALQPQIVKAAARLDTAASTFAEAVAAFRDLKQLQAGAIAGTDRGPEAVRARSYRPQEVASALYVALRARGVEVEGVTGSNSALPLAATEPEKL